ncbi:hypothetical protein D3C87_1097930 [compost metagenome]
MGASAGPTLRVSPLSTITAAKAVELIKKKAGTNASIALEPVITGRRDADLSIAMVMSYSSIRPRRPKRAGGLQGRRKIASLPTKKCRSIPKDSLAPVR